MFLSKTPSKLRLGLFAIASLCAAADNPLWEPARVVAVEQVSTPAKEPDASCRAVPKGATPPARCRPSALRAEQFWRVTVDVGNKRFVVRPYRPPKLIDLNQDGTDYVDPHVMPGSPIEVALTSSKAIRIRSDQGAGIPALVDSQELLSTPASTPRPPAVATRATSGVKVVLLENSDFRDLEIQDIKSQDIGDGILLYSFTGDSSQIRVASNNPVFLVMAESDTASGGNVELSRLQVSKGIRQMPYSLTKGHSASSIPITVTAVSATLRKFTAQEPLPTGEYVVLLEDSNRGFLFAVR